jgi:hypothetical protein
MLFFLKNMISERFGIRETDEAVVTRVEAGTKAVLYFFFERGDSAPSVVVKASSDTRFNDELRGESTNLIYLHEALPAGIREGVPSVEADGEWMGLYFYAQRYFRGEMLDETIDDRPPGAGGADPGPGIRAAWAWLGEFQDLSAGAAVRLGEAGFETLFGLYREAFDPKGEEAGYLDDIAGRLEAGRDIEIGMSACHGDFFPGNIILSGGRVSVIDWRFLRRSYNRFFDFFTLLLTFYASSGGVTDYEDHQGHFRKLFFEKHWTGELFAGLCREFMERNGAGADLFGLMLELTLLEWSVREFAGSGESGEMDRIWRSRFLYYIGNRDRFVPGRVE